MKVMKMPEQFTEMDDLEKNLCGGTLGDPCFIGLVEPTDSLQIGGGVLEEYELNNFKSEGFFVESVYNGKYSRSTLENGKTLSSNSGELQITRNVTAMGKLTIVSGMVAAAAIAGMCVLVATDSD